MERLKDGEPRERGKRSGRRGGNKAFREATEWGGGGGRVGGGGERGIIFVSSAVVFREDNAPWEPQSWVQPTQKTRPGITVQRWLAFRPPVCLRASATSRFSPGRGEKGPKRCETKVSGKMVPLRENEGRRSEIAERLVIASA